MPRVRTLFLSDIHLGTRACQAERLLDFLREYTADELYLIGDIIDFWAMKRGIHWNAAQNTVVQKVLRRARHGEQVVFIPGNHDEALRDYVDSAFGDIQVVEEAVHTTADGRRFLLIHGDAFDQVTRHHRWVAMLGDVSYNLLVRANRWTSWLRRKLGLAGYWSLAGYAKRRVKKALNFIFDFEETPCATPPRAASTASSAATSTAPSSSRSTARPTSTAATGWIPAPPSSSTWTAAWNWWNGMRRPR